MAKRVSEKEKEKMWQLYNSGMTYTQIGKKIKRDRSTVSRYIGEYEAATRATSYVMNAVNADLD